MGITTSMAVYVNCQRKWMHLHIMTQRVKVMVCYRIGTKDFVTVLQS